ncbi:hypothetical protein [Streptomyces sp. MAR4 CNX-425]
MIQRCRARDDAADRGSSEIHYRSDLLDGCPAGTGLTIHGSP